MSPRIEPGPENRQLIMLSRAGTDRDPDSDPDIEDSMHLVCLFVPYFKNPQK